MGRHASGVATKGARKEKPLASSGRNVEGASYTIVMDRGEKRLRCKGCGLVVDIAAWWRHACATAGAAT